MPNYYEAKSTVNIRKEPRIVDNILGHNRVGQLSAGSQREVFSIYTDNNNVTWGRISEPDATGTSLWVCIKNTNRTFMQLVSSTSQDTQTWAQEIDKWARDLGFNGPKP